VRLLNHIIFFEKEWGHEGWGCKNTPSGVLTGPTFTSNITKVFM